MSSTAEQVSNHINGVSTDLGNTSDYENHVNTDQAFLGAQKEAVLASAAEGRRLYIGNLAYATTEGELQSFFEGYLIESTSIPKNPRTDRPVGYAFVDLSTPSEAERAIVELSGKEILNRKVSVQLARKPEPITEKVVASDVDAGHGGEVETGRRKMSGRGRGRGRGRGGRGGRHPPDAQHKPADDPSSGESLPVAENPVKSESNENNENQTVTESNQQRKKHIRAPREKRARGPPANGIPSKTKVMVANLPYDFSEEKLKELFVDYQPVSAKIALRPIPRYMVKKLQLRNEPRRGRGFGFVNLSSNELQDRAVAEMNGKDIEGRAIAVKIAIDSPDKIPNDLKTENTAENGEVTNGINQAHDTNGTSDSKNVTSDFENNRVDLQDSQRNVKSEDINGSDDNFVAAA